jgi:hypothetical protein
MIVNHSGLSFSCTAEPYLQTVRARLPRPYPTGRSYFPAQTLFFLLVRKMVRAIDSFKTCYILIERLLNG